VKKIFTANGERGTHHNHTRKWKGRKIPLHLDWETGNCSEKGGCRRTQELGIRPAYTHSKIKSTIIKNVFLKINLRTTFLKSRLNCSWI